MENKQILSQIRGKLVVSCQALEEEPLHSSFIMGRMAKAAMLGGAGGIRANSVVDIAEIKKNVPLPIIGIIKKIYPFSPVYITPTMEEIDALAACGVAIIATDATNRPRPGDETLESFFFKVRQKYPNQLFMADCSTAEEAINAQKLGFDIVSTTLCGYTEYTKGSILPNFDMIQQILQAVTIPLIVEGGIWEAATFAKVHAIVGIHSVVIGSAITRPMEITKHFLQSIQPY